LHKKCELIARVNSIFGTYSSAHGSLFHFALSAFFKIMVRGFTPSQRQPEQEWEIQSQHFTSDHGRGTDEHNCEQPNHWFLLLLRKKLAHGAGYA
jgi:hypothetical protein